MYEAGCHSFGLLSGLQIGCNVVAIIPIVVIVDIQDEDMLDSFRILVYLLFHLFDLAGRILPLLSSLLLQRLMVIPLSSSGTLIIIEAVLETIDLFLEFNLTQPLHSILWFQRVSIFLTNVELRAFRARL